MAEKLNAANAKPKNNVVKLPTRKAKGASGAKRTIPKDGDVLKPRPDVAAGHNQGPKSDPKKDEAAIRQAQQDKLRGLTQKHIEIDARITVISASLSEERGRRSEIRTAIHNIGIPMEIFEESYRALKLKTKRRDLEAYERIRDVVREAFNQPRGPQDDLFAKIPKAAQPAVFWEAEGYTHGISNQPYDMSEVPPEHHQDYLRGFQQSTARNAAGLKALESDMAPISNGVGAKIVADLKADAEAKDDAWEDDEIAPGDAEWEAAAPAVPPEPEAFD